MKQHPLSAAFPSMPEEDLEALADDIGKRGLIEPVIVFEGMILDGWHRFKACEKAGKKVATQPFDGKDPVGFVLARNLHRRHMTASQRAAAIVAATNWRSSVGRPAGNSAPGAELSAKSLAEKAEVSTRTIEQAKEAQRAGLGDAVKEGKVSAKAAAEVAKLPEPERKQAVKAIQEGKKPSLPARPQTESAEVLKLRAKVAELEEKLRDATDEIERLSSVEQGEEAALIKRLQAELKAVTAKRDDAMRENAEMKRQIKFLQKKAA